MLQRGLKEVATGHKEVTKDRKELDMTEWLNNNNWLAKILTFQVKF